MEYPREVSWIVVTGGVQSSTMEDHTLHEGSSLALNADYVVGLVDGEGSFTFRLNTNPARRNRVEPRFTLKLRSEDKPVLDALHKFFRCGKVYIQRDRRPRHSLCYRFEVGNRNDLLQIIIPFFREYPPRSPSKIRDFALLCKAMEVIAAGNHLTEEGRSILSTLQRQLHWQVPELAECGKTARSVGT